MADFREVKAVSDVAKFIEVSHPIDFAMLRIDEDELFSFCANCVIEHFVKHDKSYITEQEIQLMAQVTYNMVESFVLNMQQNDKIITALKGKKKKGNNEE